MASTVNVNSFPQCGELMKFVSDVEKKISEAETTVGDPTSIYMRAYREMPGSHEAACFKMWCDRIGALKKTLNESSQVYLDQIRQIEQCKQILMEESKNYKARYDALQIRESKKSKSHTSKKAAPKTAASKTAFSTMPTSTITPTQTLLPLVLPSTQSGTFDFLGGEG